MASVITIVGLGYVGLPLALEFGKKFITYGYDKDSEKILSYCQGVDPVKEMSKDKFLESSKLIFTADPSCIKRSDFVIICVPTPVDKNNEPDLTAVIEATKLVAERIKYDTIIVYESTVAPGTTETICKDIITGITKVRFGLSFSPERIKPGDQKHSLTNVIKIVSGDSQRTLEDVSKLYEHIIKAGIYQAPSIKVAEAAKIIENIQRDVNIALINELAMLFHEMNISIYEVLKAAGTKWNFLNFEPGLVGGHCIGVDPYYLSCKARDYNFNTKLILSGREINDNMAKYIADQIYKCNSIRSDKKFEDMTFGIFGVTFKNDCSDIRNSKVFDIVKRLLEYNVDINKIYLTDPVANYNDVKKQYGFNMTVYDQLPQLDNIIISVNHSVYKFVDTTYFTAKASPGCWLFDVKSIFK